MLPILASVVVPIVHSMQVVYMFVFLIYHVFLEAANI